MVVYDSENPGVMTKWQRSKWKKNIPSNEVSSIDRKTVGDDKCCFDVKTSVHPFTQCVPATRCQQNAGSVDPYA